MTSSGATDEIRTGFELDVPKLESWLLTHVPEFTGPLSVRQFKAGQSNPTYLASTPTRSYVLRRKPPGKLLASAHAIDREYRVLEALGRHTDVPVPRVLALCTDDAVIGSWFYVMEHVEGRVFVDPAFPEIRRTDRAAYLEAMTRALAALHRVDYSSIGLADFGKPTAYFERQIARWSRQYREDDAAGRVPAMDRLAQWLPLNVPAGTEAGLVHGDYRCDNLMFHPQEPRVLAILDWELSTIGHPLADFGYLLTMYRLPTLAFPGLQGRDLAELNVPSAEALVELYCACTGRESIPNLDFYVAFSLFRLAAIFHGIRGRVLRGTAVSERAREYARHVETVAEIGWQQVRLA